MATKVLAGCASDSEGRGLDPAFFRNMAISERLWHLLELAFLGESELTVSFNCMRPDCRQPLEVTLGIAELEGLQSAADQDACTLKIEGEELQLRRPTGRDQMNWLAGEFPDEQAALQRMLQDLIVKRSGSSREAQSPFAEEWVQTLDRAMAEFDPLIHFRLVARCPSCEQDNPHEIDLEGVALARLREVQRRLLEMVHRLAAHYHWREAEILQLPVWRRRHYLNLIEKERGS